MLSVIDKLDLTSFYARMKQSFLTQCLECAACVESCKVRPFIPDPFDGREAIRGIKSFLEGRKINETAERFVDACMYCFGCVEFHCPMGIDTLVIQELCQAEKLARSSEGHGRDIYPDHEERMRKYTNPGEYARITTASFDGRSGIVLFPGCNVYRQPDKILNMLDIMDAIRIPYSFLPGIEYCCGNMGRVVGDASMMSRMAEKLIEKLIELCAETVVFWCPTCACNVRHIFDRLIPNRPFEIITFGAYMLQHIDQMQFPDAAPCRITFHEPCKSAWMGIDSDAIRNVLRAIPGTELVEMQHHHENTMCCGCAAVADAPQIGSLITEQRLNEARATGAEKMLDVCHYCHWVFRTHQDRLECHDLDIENYSTYIARAMGFQHVDCMSLPS